MHPEERREHRWAGVVGGAAAAVLMAGLLSFGLIDRPDHPTSIATKGDAPSSTAGDLTTTSVEPPTTTTTTTQATTTSLVCRNSTNPACGAFYFDYPAENTPPTITLDVSPAAPKVGEEVTFTVTYDDPDGAPISRCEYFQADGLRPADAPSDIGVGECADGKAPGFGAWDPPPPEHRTRVFTYTYDREPGQRSVSFQTEENGRCPSPEEHTTNCDHSVSRTWFIGLHPADEPSTTTTSSA